MTSTGVARRSASRSAHTPLREELADALGDALADAGKLRQRFDAAGGVDLGDRAIERLDGVGGLLVGARLERHARHVEKERHLAQAFGDGVVGHTGGWSTAPFGPTMNSLPAKGSWRSAGRCRPTKVRRAVRPAEGGRSRMRPA